MRRKSRSTQWELPFGRGKALGSGVSKPVDLLIGGRGLNCISTVQNGLPMSITSQTNTLRDFGGTQRQDGVRGVPMDTEGSNQDRVNQWITPAAFVDAPEYTYGTLGMYNSELLGPNYISWDISILKDFTVTERVRLQFRGEFFDAFTGTSPARVIQFGLKSCY